MKRWNNGNKNSQLVAGTVLVAAFFMMALIPAGHAYAQQSSSTNYMVNEVQMGAGSSLEDCSTNYCARTSAGDLVAGSGSSTNYSAQFGFNTSDEPFLEVITQAGNHDLGVLDSSTTASTAAYVKVRSYQSQGYVIQITGSPPKNGAHALAAIPSPSSAQPGAEQFGLNLVQNSNPAVGADPVQVPDGTFSFGSIMSNYSTSDLFMYQDGDIVAHSLSSSGETDYTLSMIFNISNITPGGQYKGSLSAVVTPVF